MSPGNRRPKGVPVFQVLSLDKLFVDERYQRNIGQLLVRDIINEFDPARLGVLEVSTRSNGRYAIFDGQNRYTALKELAHKSERDATAPCLVHTGLTAQDEAMLFVGIQTGRKKPTPVESFRARVFGGDEIAVEIQEVFDSLDITVGFGTQEFDSAGIITAVTAAERVYYAGNLEETLTILMTLWSEEKKALNGTLIDAMSLFLLFYGSQLVENYLFEKLEETTPTLVIRKAQAMRAVGADTGMRNLIFEVLRKQVSSRMSTLRKPGDIRSVTFAIIRDVLDAMVEEDGSRVRLTQAEITRRTGRQSAQVGPTLLALHEVGLITYHGQQSLGAGGGGVSKVYSLKPPVKKSVTE